MYFKQYQIAQTTKTNTEILSIIEKNLNKCIHSLKYYSSINLRYAIIKPFGDALNQLIKEIDKMNNFSFFIQIVLETILYCEFPSNKMFIPIFSEANPPSAVPFLPPITSNTKYTLVLDMDETLIHYFLVGTKGMFFIRPFCLQFLNELKSLYEIVIFTSGTKEYADRILNSLDKRGDIFKYRLYRQHTTLDGYISVKDLSLLGRDLNKTIIIDNLKDNFKVQPDNGLFIKTWISDILDEEMRQLERILKDIVKYRVKDVRSVIRSIHNEINNDKMYNDIDISKIINTKS